MSLRGCLARAAAVRQTARPAPTRPVVSPRRWCSGGNAAKKKSVKDDYEAQVKEFRAERERAEEDKERAWSKVDKDRVADEDRLSGEADEDRTAGEVDKDRVAGEADEGEE